MRTWILGILALVIWSGGCTYWYVCQIKGLCPDGVAMFADLGSTNVEDNAATNTSNGMPPKDSSTASPPPTIQQPLPSTLERPLTVLFAFAGPVTANRDAMNAYLDELANYLKTNPAKKAFVKGYTDDTAARENNLKLSQRRCDVIAALLQDRGVNAGQIVTEPMGEADPVATNDTPGGRRLNRRVVISIQE